MKKLILLKFLLLLIIVGSISHKSTHAQTQFSGWFANFSSFKLTNKFSIHFDAQLRSTNNIEHISTLLLRTGLNMHFTKNLTATAGYAFIHNRRVLSGVSGYAPEHRIWQQFIVTHPLINTTMSHRFRLEQRFIARSRVENNDLVNEGTVYANRFRYFFRTLLPLKKKLQEKTPFINLQNEAFVNLGDKSGVNGEFFDQNRAYISLGYRFVKQFDIEIGYMNQYINGRNHVFTNNHIVQLATYLRL
jgi:hypothetical protein